MAAGLSVGTAIALTTVIAVTNGSADSTSNGNPANGSSGTVSPDDSSNSSANQDGFGATPRFGDDDRSDPFGDGNSSGSSGGNSNGGSFTPHTRSGGS